jgi:Na+/pantothenate symporter
MGQPAAEHDGGLYWVPLTIIQNKVAYFVLAVLIHDDGFWARANR